MKVTLKFKSGKSVEFTESEMTELKQWMKSMADTSSRFYPSWYPWYTENEYNGNNRIDINPKSHPFYGTPKCYNKNGGK